MFTKKIRAKEELVNGRATGIKIPFSFMPCLRNETERNGFGVLFRIIVWNAVSILLKPR